MRHDERTSDVCAASSGDGDLLTLQLADGRPFLHRCPRCSDMLANYGGAAAVCSADAEAALRPLARSHP